MGGLVRISTITLLPDTLSAIFKGLSELTPFLLARGSYDAANRNCTFIGEMAGSDGSPVPVRGVMHIADNDHFAYEYYEARNGKEALAVRPQYTRLD